MKAITYITFLFLTSCASAGAALIKAGSVAVSGLEAANAINTACQRSTDPIRDARGCSKLPKTSTAGAACRQKQHCARSPRDPICSVVVETPRETPPEMTAQKE